MKKKKENKNSFEKKTFFREPQLDDFYDSADPRGCSTTEYNMYLKALNKYNN